MKDNNYYQNQNQNQAPAGSARSALVKELDQNEMAFIPSPEEVARLAYFSYLNQGSQSGRDVQHWLEAEKQLIAERNLNRVHGAHNKN